MRRIFFLIAVVWLLTIGGRADDKIYVAIIGGLSRSGLWPELSKRFEASSKYKLKLVDSGNRDVVAGLFREGELDLAVLHGGEVASNLVTEGFASGMWTWAQNEFVIIGPTNDPVGIRGFSNGAEALKRIAQTKSRFENYQNSGPADAAAILWKKAGVTPSGDWFLKTTSEKSESALEFARTNRAYVVLGRIPKIPSELEILVQNDPTMARPFVVVEANKKRFPKANAEGALALSKFLQSKETETFLRQFASNSPPGLPIFWPARNP